MATVSVEFEKIKCIICASDKNIEQIAKKGAFSLPAYVSICKNCGLVFLNPRWKKFQYTKLYTKRYQNLYSASNQSLPQKVSPKIKDIWNRLGGNSNSSFESVLDIGCGMGWFLDICRLNLDNVYLAGIEPQEVCEENITKVVGADLISDDVDSDWHLRYKNHFSVVVLRHVLEHLLNPISVLQKISFVLSDNGILYLAVPDMMNPLGSLTGNYFRAMHTYYFSEVTLLRIIHKAHLKPIKVKTEGHELWGLFQNGTFNLLSNSVYTDQINVINLCKRKDIVRKVIQSPRKALSKILPGIVKEKIKIWLN